MMYWVAVLFFLALISGAMAFGLIATAAVGTAKILFLVFLALMILSLLGNMQRQSRI